jgi:hypothetical protein
MNDSTAALVAKVREGLCPNWGAQPHGGCTYCAQNEDAINALTALAERAKAAEIRVRESERFAAARAADNRELIARAEAAEAALKEAEQKFDAVANAESIWETLKENDHLRRVEEAWEDALNTIATRRNAMGEVILDGRKVAADALAAASPREGEGE